MRYCFLFVLFLGPATVFTQADSNAIFFANSISASELKSHVYDLASDEFEGRETGKIGQKKAGVYLASFFKSLGMTPIGKDSSYFQEFPLYEEYTGKAELKHNQKVYSFLKDFYCFNSIGNMELAFQSIVFAGYGIKDEKSGYNDYKNLDVNGKIVMVFEDEPIDKKGVSRITGNAELSDWTKEFKMKVKLAKDMGAVALLEIAKNMDNDIKVYKHYIEKPRSSVAPQDPAATFPVFYISKNLATDIFAAYNKRYNYNNLKEAYRKKKKNHSFEINSDLQISIERQKQIITGENILGYIEGTDLKDELIIITAHYDHLGKDESGIYYGADDDGSGTAAIMEMAEAFMLAKNAGFGPRRSILILPVSGEEKGLLGSYYYSKNPVFPLENTVCNLNIDMIGRMDKKHESDSNYVYIIGSDKLSSELHLINENNNDVYTKIDLDYTYNHPEDPNRFYYRSDHYNFAKNQIPSIFYFTGIHDDYHKITDTPEKLHYNKMVNITRLIFYTAWEIANRPERIKVDSNKP